MHFANSGSQIVNIIGTFVFSVFACSGGLLIEYKYINPSSPSDIYSVTLMLDENMDYQSKLTSSDVISSFCCNNQVNHFGLWF